MVLLVFVPRREPFVASLAVEEDHTTDDGLHFEHLLQKFLSELRVHFRRSNRPCILRADDSLQGQRRSIIGVKTDVSGMTLQQCMRGTFVWDVPTWRSISIQC